MIWFYLIPLAVLAIYNLIAKPIERCGWIIVFVPVINLFVAIWLILAFVYLLSCGETKIRDWTYDNESRH